MCIARPVVISSILAQNQHTDFTSQTLSPTLRALMNTYSLLALYSLFIVTASMLGGYLPTRVKLTHTRMQMVMSLVSGLMLGVALFHLFPHGLQELGGMEALDNAMIWMMLGLLVMFLLLRTFHFHQHDFTNADHNHADPHDDCAHGHSSTGIAWLGVFAGLSVHTLIDGLALGAAVFAGVQHEHGSILAGLGVFLAIVLHKPLDALTITSLMQKEGWGRNSQRLANLGFGLMCPIGALVFLLGMQSFSSSDLILGAALVFSAGVFLCISLSDLLPEVQFHSHDKGKLTVLLLLGILLAYAITAIEPAYH